MEKDVLIFVRKGFYHTDRKCPCIKGFSDKELYIDYLSKVDISDEKPCRCAKITLG